MPFAHQPPGSFLGQTVSSGAVTEYLDPGSGWRVRECSCHRCATLHPCARTLRTQHLPLATFPHRVRRAPTPSVSLTLWRHHPQPRALTHGPGTRDYRPPASSRQYLRATAGTWTRVPARPRRGRLGRGAAPPRRSDVLDWLSAPGPAPVTPQAPPTLKAPS